MDEELDALLAKCVKLLEDFQYGEAEKELNIAVSLAPNRPEVWDLLGTCYLFLNKMRDAERAYRRATELAPTDSRYWHSLGSTLGHLNRFEEAESCLRKAIEIGPATGRSWASLA
ncbi:MAG: tetratricopeptide repeat protein, partial [Candidatus Thorarchaeota archaeon]